MANRSCREAEAVIDEVALLEAALREALERQPHFFPKQLPRQKATPLATLGLDTNLDGRVDTYVTGIDRSHDGIPDVLQGKQTLPEAPSTLEDTRYSKGLGTTLDKYDAAATASYGVQLRSWINWQVDHRLEQVVQEAVQKRILSVQEESGLSLALAKRAEAESEKNGLALGKLFGIVDGISKELERVTVQISEFSAVVEFVRVGLEKLEEGRIEEAETRCQVECLRKQLEPFEKELTPGLLLAVQRDIQEISKKAYDFEHRVDSCLSELDSELHTKLSEERRHLDSVLQTGMMQSQELHDLETRFGGLSESFGVLSRKYDNDDVHRQIGEWLQAFRNETEASLKKLVTELRAETTAAFRSQSVSFAALDEQLWLTDQRLGQRIDEATHATRPHGHERVLAGSSRAISQDNSRSCLSDVDDRVKLDVPIANKAPSQKLPEAPSSPQFISLRLAATGDKIKGPQSNGMLAREDLADKSQSDSLNFDHSRDSAEDPGRLMKGRLRLNASSIAATASDSSVGPRRLLFSRSVSSIGEDSGRRLGGENSSATSQLAKPRQDYIGQRQEADLTFRRGDGLQLSVDEPIVEQFGRSSSLRSLRSSK